VVVRIAQISCGTEYSGVQKEIEKAAEMVGAEMVFPEVNSEDLERIEDEFPFVPASNGLKLMIARAASLVQGTCKVDGVMVLTCFRCAEGSLTRTIVRKMIQQKTKLPLISYSFTERTNVGNLLLRMEALVNMVEKKALLARKRHEGLTLGIDSGSTMTKTVVMREGEIIGKSWLPTTDVLESAKKAVLDALTAAGVTLDSIEAVGVTGYGRHILGKLYNAKIAMEEITVCSKGATYLSGRLDGDATIIDIGGADNKAITVHQGIPDSFTVGSICAGASGRFLEVVAARLGVDLPTLGRIALKGNPKNVKMNAYCIVFGMHDLVSALSLGASAEDVAMAACYSVAEQFYEQQMQEIDVREPVIQIGGTSLVEGLTEALKDILKVNVIVPPLSQYAGAVGAAVLASGLRET